MQTREFVTRLFERHGHGLIEKLTAISYHNVTARAQHGLAGGSTGTADCGFRYLLVKAFARRSIFEIGTYVGTSAVAMAMADGHVTTCDPKDYGCLPAGIRFLNMTDRDALRLLRREAAIVDMVFADVAVSSDAIAFLNKIGSDDMIFTAHDYASGRKARSAWTSCRSTIAASRSARGSCQRLSQSKWRQAFLSKRPQQRWFQISLSLHSNAQGARHLLHFAR